MAGVTGTARRLSARLRVGYREALTKVTPHEVWYGLSTSVPE